MEKRGMRWVAVIWVVLGIGVVAASAGEEHHAAVAGSSELEQVKRLAGRWEGTSQMDTNPEQSTTVEYKVTSGGSAVVETLFPGTPHEMVSVYHDTHSKKLSMTHYCMIGNQPELELTRADGQQLAFNLSPGSPIPSSEEHMHALNITWDGPDRLMEVWTSYKDGKATSSATFRLARAH